MTRRLRTLPMTYSAPDPRRDEPARTAAPKPMRHPGVRFPPPALFVAGLLAGWALHRHVRALALPGLAPAAARGVGLGLVLAGLALAGWGVVTFRRARTAIIPHYPASRVVDGGPYRFTRNPMYTGFTVVYLGVAALLGSAWPLLLLPLVLVALVRLVIAREERYLRAAFGADYEGYCARVRRWL